MVKKNNYFTCFIFFAVLPLVPLVTLLVCGKKNILPNLTNSKEPEPVFFGPLKPEPLEKKYQEPEPLGKKTGAGAA